VDFLGGFFLLKNQKKRTKENENQNENNFEMKHF